ncbi:uvs039 domain protein [Photobacterium leiognathi lrivu.4.1]|uniref:Uvs039 domain protein n=2 Tax=Photobacterium leiognathi TaxID=553611 RepID=V5F4F7_PHOLE|nr:uvs039 domain protein [Photobacterium leiognathi lrivu.4.1]
MLSNTKRTEIKKSQKKAVFETAKLYQIIDESLIAHIAINQDDQPFVIPMLVWRV